MTEHTPEMDPAATFRLDQEAGAAEATTWEAIRLREATTTLEQREALTDRVNAQANLLTTLNVLVWLAVLVAAWWGIIELVRWFL